MTAFDVAVVGLGLMGSAALRALSEDAGLRAVGVGPAEPEDWARHDGAFASHYDHGRITRVTDPHHTWAVLAQRSIKAYPAIAERGGIAFHHPVGHLRLGLAPDDAVIAASELSGQELGAPLERLEGAALAERFPYLRFPAGAVGLYELGGAGWVNPRALVAAQLAAAQAQGAAVLRDEVRAIRRAGGDFELDTRGGRTIAVARVLVSAHGYSGELLRPLIGGALAIENRAQTVVYAELRPEQGAALAGMPSLIWPLKGHPVLPSVYTTSPARYADGRWYLKIGGPLHAHKTLDTPEAILGWFRGPGNPDEIAGLRETLQAIMPGLDIIGWGHKVCMTSYTSHGLPFIDRLDDGLFVCAGGCGAAAKSSDAIGRLGAELARHGEWRDDLPADGFRAVLRAA